VVLLHNSTICEDLNNHVEIGESVQRTANTFSISDDLLNTWPPMLAALVAGSLSDRSGGNRRWLICLPVIGAIVTVIFQALHYSFIW
jgi:hypothetical protein